MLELYNADAYQKINELLDSGIKVDHIITDPPYNISQDNNFHTMKSHRRGVDFGEDEPLLSLSVGKMSTRIIGDFSYNGRSSSTKIDVTLYSKDYKVENHVLNLLVK